MKKKLTNSQLSEIFKRYKINEETQTDIAKDYGVTPGTISHRLKYFEMESAVAYKKSGYDINKVAQQYNMDANEASILVQCGMDRIDFNLM